MWRHILRTTQIKSLLGALLISFVVVASHEATAACRGAWAEGTTYQTGDTVTYSGSVYTARSTHTACVGCGWNPVAAPSLWSLGGTCSGTSPTPTPTPTPRPSSSSTPRPTPTPTPTTSTSCPQWVAGKQYYTGNKVTYNGAYYVAEHDNPGYDPTVSTWYWDPTTCSGGTSPTPTPTPTPTSSTGFTSLFTESMFNQMFPNRASFYTYQGLVSAQALYTGFGGSGDTAMRKREIAAAMANFHHETGGLVHVIEQNTANHCHYCDSGQPYGCPAGSCAYYGRGPIQLSWNFNYKAAGDAIGINILNDPNQVQNNAATAWKTALWYWMSQNGPNVRNAHDCIIGNHGFGCTIRSINGALECDGKYPAVIDSRVNQFNRAKSIIGATSVGADRC